MFVQVLKYNLDHMDKTLDGNQKYIFYVECEYFKFVIEKFTSLKKLLIVFFL